MKKFGLLVVLLATYIVIIIPFASFMRSRTYVERLGYVPDAFTLRFLSADQYRLTAASLIAKVISYYGTISDMVHRKKLHVRPEYPEIERTIETAVKLDPYNMDSYYFGQAIMVWDAKRVQAANDLLEYGMRYRTWDFYLPYFAGFNYAYFLKDYKNAAKYYARVAELTGDPLMTRLTGRYLYESGQTDLAISYLSMMVKGARNDAVRASLQTRLDAFKAAKKVEVAISHCDGKFHQKPRSIEELLRLGCLSHIPVDPYGGKFYIDKYGRVDTTSKFAHEKSRAE